MATRADNKDGSLREVLTGKHKGKWRVQYTQVGGTGKKERIDRLFPTKTAGKDFLHGLRHGTRVALAKQKKELTLGDWITWLAENDWSETLAQVTVTQRQRRFAKYVKAHFGDIPLTMLDPLKVRAFYQHLRKEGVSDSTILSVKSDLVRAFNQAITPYGRVPMTTANPFRLPLATPPKREAVALTPDQARKAIQHPDLDSSRRTMLGLFLLAGVRLGEQMAITKGQLRFKEGLIVIDRAVRVEFGGKQSVGLPKGGKTRNAVMSPTLKALLLEHTKDMNDEDLLWPSATENKPRMKKLVYATWRTIVKDAKLPSEMSPHDCRLSHTNMIEKLMPEVSATTLKEHIGHAASGVTEANYTRPLSPAQKILSESIERTVFPKKRGS